MPAVPHPRFREHGNVVDLVYHRQLSAFKKMWDEYQMRPNMVWYDGFLEHYDKPAPMQRIDMTIWDEASKFDWDSMSYRPEDN